MLMHALDSTLRGREKLAPSCPLRAFADGRRIATAHVAGNPEPALADAKLDVIAPIGGDVERGSDQTDTKPDNQQNKPRLNRIVELVPEARHSLRC
jgi:hypothetical protein